MPLDSYRTQPDYSRQLKQYSGTSATFSGTTNILEAFYVKSVEIDTVGAVLSDALLFDGIKFRPAQPGGFSGSVITNGFNLSYVSGLTYRVSPGTYRFNNTIYPYLGEDFNILSGQSGGSRFDLVYISGGTTSISVRTGTTTTNPTIPNLQVGELEVGVIFVPINFTGGTGSTIIQTTAATVFEYYNNGAGNGIQRTAAGSNTSAPGSFSFAVGRDSDAYAPDSVTLGVDTKASGNSQTVVGTFNIPTTTDYFIVGHGTDDSNRANAFNITNAGDTYANRKLFVTNIQIETTGASNGQVLKFDGTKFKPQLESITGLTLLTGGTNFISSITSNSLLVKALTGSTGITITESNGLITIGLNFSGTNAITDILSLTGGTSIISGKTGTTYFLYPIQGSGGTSVNLVDGKLLVYSDSSGSTTGQNIGFGSEVFAGKSVNELQFRRLSSATPTNLTITQVGDTLVFSASASATTTVTLFEDVSYSQLKDKITGSTLQIGKQYRITSGRINEGAGTFGYVIVNAIDINKISKNGTLIALNPDYYNGGNYTDVAVTPLGSSGIAYSGQTLFTNQVSIYNNNHYKVTANTTFNNTLTNLALLSRDFVNDYGYITTNDYIEYDFTSDTITKRVDSIGNTVEGKSAIDVFPWGRKNQVLNNRVINNSIAEIMNFRGIISGNTFDNNARLVSSFDDTNFIFDNTNIRNNVLISAATFINTQFRNCDISTNFGLVNRTLSNYNFDSKLVSSDVNQLETNLNVSSNTLDLTNFNHFGVFNISAASSTFSINAIQNYNQTYKLTFKPLAGYLFNFVHSSTIRNELEDTHPIDGNYQEIITYQKRSKAGTVFYQENINTFKALSAVTTPIIGGIVSVDTTGAKSLIESVSSASTTGRTATFRALVEGTNITIDDTTAPGYLIINSQASGTTTITGLDPTGVGPYEILSSITNNKLVFKTISAGTGMNITDDGNGTITFNASGSTGISGVYVSGLTSAGTGNYSIISSITDNNLIYRTISAGTNFSINDDGNGTLTFNASGSTGISGKYVSGLTSAGTGNYLLLSSVTTGNTLVFKSISAGTNVNITESNGTLTFNASGITSGISLDNGVRILFSSDTNNLAFASLSSQTPNTLRIISSSTGVILFSAATVATTTAITTGTSLGSGVKVLFSSDTTNLTFSTLSSQTPSTLSIISSSTGVILFSAATVPPTTAITTGASLGNGVNILFSSNTTSLSFATLSSQTPSTLSIISSSTGVILFSATTGNAGISGVYVSGITSAGTGNIHILSSVTTGNTLVYKTISAGTNIGITESNGTIIISGSGGISGNFLPISGGTVTGLTNFISGLSANTISATTYYNLPTYDNEIHVSQVDGSDTTGNGDLLNPVKTITKALTLTTVYRKTIIVHPGGYNENITVTSGNTTIATSELTGANTVLYGTLTIGTLGSGSRISGLKMNNLVISETAQAYISNCTVDTQVTKSSSGYVEIINSEMQCTLGIQISGSGITIINGNKNVAVSVSNASAQVIIKGCNSVVTPSASAGNLAIVDSIVTALGGYGITITNSSTTLTLANSQVLVQAGNSVAPISVAGIYSIINTIYDKPNSTFAGGTSTNSIDYFQYINADGLYTTSISATTISATSIDRLNYIDFNTGTTQSPAFGRVYFDGTEKALTYYGQTDTPVRIGQQLYSRVINNSGSLIPKGSAVKITGATSGLPAINLAIADHTSDNRVAGITVFDIANGATGLIITKGLFSGLTLNNYNIGDSLFLSPFSAGTYTSSTTSFPFNSRVNRLGRVVTTGTTTGQIFVDIANEDNTLSLTSIERNILEGNVVSTGTYEYTGLTLGTGKTINISPLRGWIVKNTYEYATVPDVTNIYYSGGTNVTVTNLATAESTFLLINSASTLVQQTTFPTPQQRRQNIFIGKVVHPDKVNITSLNQTVDFDVSPMSALRDLWTPIKLINQGIIVSYYSSGTMNIQTSSGTLWGNGIGWISNQLNPDSVTISGTSPTTFQYRSRNGAITGSTGGSPAPTGNTTTIDAEHYDLNGNIVSLGGANRASNQRVYLFPTGLIRIQYGQAWYSSIANAIAGIDTEVFVEYSNNRDNGILIGILTVRQNASDLSDTGDAQFRFVSKFGELLGGAGGISTTTLQQAYDNSSFPVEILTNSTLGALHVKNGTGNPDSASTIFEAINSLGTSTAFMRADGVISGTSFLGDASNLTGVLSKTLLTANIPVTSQVAQVNTFYLYDKLTITSATSSATVTAITSNASISAYTPSIKFFANTGVTVTFKNSATLKTEGGLDAVIVGSNYDSITFTYNNNIQKYFQTNINNYI